MKNVFRILIITPLVFLSFTNFSYAKEEVNVYSFRQPILIDPFFEEFTNKILDVLKNKNLNKFISNNGYKRYNKYFSAKTMSKKYFETII